MPKARKGAGSDVLFSVQPWQHKGDKPAAEGAADAAEYTVVEENLLPGPREADRGQPAAALPPASLPEPPPWRSAVRRPDINETKAVPDALATPSTAVLPPAPPPAMPHPRRSLSGTATLISLGESRLAGTFTIDSTGGSYPLHGRQFSGYRECTRDEAWAVVTLRLLRLPGPGLPEETVVVAERAGGDAMRLTAPVEWQGDEEREVAAAGEATPGVALTFQCEQLLADAAADEILAEMMPRAVGLGAVVNVGTMEVSWDPRGGGGGGGGGGGWGGGGPGRVPAAAAPYDNDLDG